MILQLQYIGAGCAQRIAGWHMAWDVISRLDLEMVSHNNDCSWPQRCIQTPVKGHVRWNDGSYQDARLEMCRTWLRARE